MNILLNMEKEDFEQIVFCQDKETNLKAIIAIHSTFLGPALGGLRMFPYPTEEEALEDVLKLAIGMTYKNSAAGVNLGGGKAVIIGDPKKDKTKEMLVAFSKYVNSLNGRYITAEDSGTTVEDMDIILQHTPFVVGSSASLGKSGDPAPFTAYGVYVGIKLVVEKVLGKSSLEGLTIAVQGAGNVSYNLCPYFLREGAKVVVSDVREEAVLKFLNAFKVSYVDPEKIYDVKCDVFVPCALGGILNIDTVKRLDCSIVAGCANNQLKDDIICELIEKKGIFYVPDFIINAGGLINVSFELEGYDKQKALKKIKETIYKNILEILDLIFKTGITSNEAAKRIALKRLKKSKVKKEKEILGT